MSSKQIVLIVAVCLLFSVDSLLSLQTYCTSDSDCSEDQVCSGTQTCDQFGCKESSKDLCIDVSLTSLEYQRSHYIELYLSKRLQYNQTTPQFTIRTPKDGSPAISFEKRGDISKTYRMGIHSDLQTFVIAKEDATLLSINSSQVGISTDIKVNGQLKFNLQSTFLIGQVSQWKLVHEETNGEFDTSDWWIVGSEGTALTTSECGLYTLLGGYGVLGNVQIQTNISLASYTYTHIKLEAVFHFIDSWQGQTAYLQLPKTSTYLWTDSFDYSTTTSSSSICGTDVGEGKFTSLISSVFTQGSGVYDDEETLSLLFGTTLTSDSTYASWGISSLRVLIR